jgi:hypothetical protein
MPKGRGGTQGGVGEATNSLLSVGSLHMGLNLPVLLREGGTSVYHRNSAHPALSSAIVRVTVRLSVADCLMSILVKPKKKTQNPNNNEYLIKIKYSRENMKIK